MTICLDATPLTITSGGLPRYVSELTEALTAEFPASRFVLSSDQPFQSPLPRLQGPSNWLERRWWLYGAEKANRRAGVDLYHGTNFSVPYLAKRPTAMTIHDLSPWMNPAWHAGAGRVRNRTPRMVGLATMIITLTQAVKHEVIERFGVAPDQVAVTPLAAAPGFYPAKGPVAKPYFVFVGTLEPRKNIAMLLEAWREVRREYDIDLLLAGRRRPDLPPVPPEEGLRILGEVPEAALPGLYSNALGALYVSEYEGFGLPVLEAMQCGAPAIVSRDPALTEVSGGAALAVGNSKELVEAMVALFRNPDLRTGLSQRSRARASEFSWRKTARLTYEVYGEAIGRFGR